VQEAKANYASKYVHCVLMLVKPVQLNAKNTTWISAKHVQRPVVNVLKLAAHAASTLRAINQCLGSTTPKALIINFPACKRHAVEANFQGRDVTAFKTRLHYTPFT